VDILKWVHFLIKSRQDNEFVFSNKVTACLYLNHYCVHEIFSIPTLSYFLSTRFFYCLCTRVHL